MAGQVSSIELEQGFSEFIAVPRVGQTLCLDVNPKCLDFAPQGGAMHAQFPGGPDLVAVVSS